jgi:hypothetical protein
LLKFFSGEDIQTGAFGKGSTTWTLLSFRTLLPAVPTIAEILKIV